MTANNNNQFVQFNNCVNDVITCKLIMVDKHFANLLRCVANMPIFTACISDTLKNSSYVTEFNRARVTLTRPDGIIEARLKLPAEKQRLFTFVVCLLVEIDSGRRNFIEFLKEYYYNTDSNISYEQFVAQVIRPFKKAGENILKVASPDDIDMEAQLIAEKHFFSERIYISGEIVRLLLSTIEDIRQLLGSGVVFDNATQEKECKSMCNALTNAIQLKYPKIIDIVFVGMKNTLSPIAVTHSYLTILSNELRKLQLI